MSRRIPQHRSFRGACSRGRTPPCPRRIGFTLIELLVVVVIVTLLAAILLPVLSWAQQHSRRVGCQSNLRQLARAWQQYLDANDGKFLRGFDVNLHYGGGQGTVDAAEQGGRPKPLNQFVGLPAVARHGAEVFACPADTGSDDATPTHFDYYGTSYNPNPMLIGQDEFPTSGLDPCQTVMDSIESDLKHLTRHRIADESTLLLIGDYGWVDEWNIASTRRIEWHGRPARHTLAYVDGHTGFLAIAKGMYLTSEYTVVPFGNLQSDLLDCQGTGP